MKRKATLVHVEPQAIKLPAPPRTAYSIMLSEHCEIHLFPPSDVELCVTKSQHGVVVWTRKSKVRR